MDRFAKVRERDDVIAGHLAAMYRAPWRFLRNRRLRREARELIAENFAEIERVRRTPRS
jgi:glycine/D-amino acid oxidase-like deaminating enzyme